MNDQLQKRSVIGYLVDKQLKFDNNNRLKTTDAKHSRIIKEKMFI